MTLGRYLPAHAHEVAGWLVSLEEVEQWAGASTGWPVDPAVFEGWHSDTDVQPSVLYYAEQVVGYGELWIDEAEDEVELARLVIHPVYRNRGVGRRLVTLLLERAKSTGLSQAFVRVVPENARAVACYRQAGFSFVSPGEQQEFNQGQPVEYLWLRSPLQ